MRLSELLGELPAPAEPAGPDPATVEVEAIAIDSRRVGPGTLFCCIAGSRVDGHDLVPDAVAAGAVAVLAERPVDAGPGVAVAVVPSVREAVGPLAAALFGHPSRSLTVVGVTGTNGKTTVTHLLRSILEAAGLRAEAIGTLTGAPGAPPTTPDAPDLQARLARLRDAGVAAVAMEVSSHGLAMHRVDGTRFAAAVFTNLSQDHLDLHGTMESYFAAKARLFDTSFCDRAVVCVDDPHGRLLLDAAVVPTVGYSIGDAEVLRAGPDGTDLRWRGVEVHVPIAGRFNALNAIGAATTAAELGIDAEVIARGIAAAPPVPGRFEPVDEGQPFTVVVDYAHTPDGLEAALTGAREVVGPGGRVVVVFGAGGDRDPAKRPRMGAVAARLADLAVVTSDNPRSEDPAAIIDAIVAGVPSEPRGEVRIEPDRRAAIALAVGAARPGDVVVVAGKGHETTQVVGDRVVPFVDADVAREALRERGFGR